MWPTYTTGAGTGRNRRLLKDRDGRPAMARSGSRRRKEGSRRAESGALNTTTHTVRGPACAEEDIDNETLPALPPSRPSTTSPLPSPKLSDETTDLLNSLYRLPLPLITPAALQPYLEDETPYAGEQLMLDEAPASTSSETRTDFSWTVPNSLEVSREPIFEPSTKALDTLELTASTRSSDTGATAQLSQAAFSAINLPITLGPTHPQPSPVPYPVMPVALPTQRHALVNPTVDSYHLPYNPRHMPTFEPHVFPRWSQDSRHSLEWQHQPDPPGMTSSRERLPPFLNTQQAIVPSSSAVYGYEETAIEGLVFQVRQVASDIDVLRAHIRELFGDVENQAWNVRELERRIDGLGRRSSERHDEKKATSSHQDAVELGVLRSKIRILEDRALGKEDSISFENQNLQTRLNAATQEISCLREALAVEAPIKKHLPGPLIESLRHVRPHDTNLPDHRALANAEDISINLKSKKECIPQTSARQEHHDRAVTEAASENLPQSPTKPRARPRHSHARDGRKFQEQVKKMITDGQRPLISLVPSISHSPQLHQGQPSTQLLDHSYGELVSRHSYGASDRSMERTMQKMRTVGQDRGKETEDSVPLHFR